MFGDMVQGRQRKLSYKSKKLINNKKDDWIIVKNTHKSIIGKDMFKLANEMLQKRDCTRVKTHDYLLKGLLKCSECKHCLSLDIRKLKTTEKEVKLLRCKQHFKKVNKKKCDFHMVKLDDITEVVLNQLTSICKQYISTKTLHKIAKEKISKEKSKKEKIVDLKNQICSITQRINKVYDDKLNDIIEETEFKIFYDSAKAEREKLTKQLDLLENSDSTIKNEDKYIKELIKKFLNSTYDNRTLICSLIDYIEVSNSDKISVKIFFTFEDLNTVS